MLNPEQTNSYSSLVNFIQHGNPNTYFLLDGKAGTGKTYCVAQLIMDFPTVKFAVCAISHKAKDVIRKKIESKNVEAFTIASILGMKMNQETGEFTVNAYIKVAPITYFSVIIIDEGSMIDEKVLALIMKLKNPTAKIIFAGDIGQIRPIRKQTRDGINKLSPIFKTKFKTSLRTRVRQGEDNPILMHSDYYWENSISDHAVLTGLIREDSINADGKGIEYLDKVNTAVDKYIDIFKDAVESKDTNKIKVVTYRNAIREKINSIIRKKIFTDPEEYEIGDLMIMLDSYNDSLNEMIIENSTEFSVVDFTERVRTIEHTSTEIGNTQMTSTRVKYFNVTGLTSSGEIIEVPIIARSQKQDYKDLVSAMFTKGFNTPKYGRAGVFKEANRLNNLFASCDYGYSITAHKS